MKKVSTAKLFLPVLLSVTLLLTALITVLITTCYDSALGLFEPGTPTWLLGILFPPPLLLALFALAASPKKRWIDADRLRTSPLTRVGVLFFLLGVAFVGVTLFYGNFPNDPATTLLGCTDSEIHTLRNSAYLLRFAGYTSVLAAVFPAVILIVGRGDTFFGMITVVWLLSYDLSLYFDSATSMNDPRRLLLILSFTAMVFWTLSEIRLCLGKASHRTVRIFGAFALPLTAAGSIPSLIATALGLIPLSSRTLIEIAAFGTTIWILGRLFELANLPESDAIGGEDAPEVGDGKAPEVADAVGSDGSSNDGDDDSGDGSDGGDGDNGNDDSIGIGGDGDSSSGGDSGVPENGTECLPESAAEGKPEKVASSDGKIGGQTEKFSLLRELRRMADAPDTDRFPVRDDDDDDDDGTDDDKDSFDDGDIEELGSSGTEPSVGDQA